MDPGWTPYVVMTLTVIIIPLAVAAVQLYASHSRHADSLAKQQTELVEVRKNVTSHGEKIAVHESQLTGVGRELGQLRGAVESVDKKVDRVLEHVLEKKGE